MGNYRIRGFDYMAQTSIGGGACIHSGGDEPEFCKIYNNEEEARIACENWVKKKHPDKKYIKIFSIDYYK